MSSISKTLNLLLAEDNAGESWDILTHALELGNQLEIAKATVQQLLFKLQRAKQKMCADLAYRIRRKNPSYNISVDRNLCKIGYKRKTLYFKPDLSRNMWIVSSKDEPFANAFKRNHKHALMITPDISNFINIIDNFFRNHYKTLQEDIVGEGLIIVGSRNSDLKGLLEYRNG